MKMNRQRAPTSLSRLLVTLIFLVLPGIALADTDERFSRRGEELFYNSEVTYPGRSDVGPQPNDWNQLYYLLSKTPQIRVVVLTSLGGSLGHADKMAATLAEFDVDTSVNGLCLSSCTHIFLAGRQRILPKGALLGFHRGQYSAEQIATDVDRSGAELSPAIAAQMYNAGIEAGLNEVRFLTSHGVSAEFAIKTLSYGPENMWFPTVSELLDAGVITDR